MNNLFADENLLNPVLFVHGYWANGDITWSDIKKKLIKDGWPEIYLYNPSFDNVYGCDPEHGLTIKKWVEELKKKTERDKVDIVAHSMGALNTRYYIKFLCGYENVKDVVMIAGANKGTITACLEPISCGADSMCVWKNPDDWKLNEYLLELNSCDQTPAESILYTSIWSEYDEIVVPQENSIIDGANNIKLNDKVGHAGILFSDETYEWVKIGLMGGGLNNNVPEPEGCYSYKIACDTNVKSEEISEELEKSDIKIFPEEQIEIENETEKENPENFETISKDSFELADNQNETTADLSEIMKEDENDYVASKEQGCACKMNTLLFNINLFSLIVILFLIFRIIIKIY